MFDTLDQSTLFAEVERMTHPLTPQETARELIRLYLSYLGVERTLPEQGVALPPQSLAASRAGIGWPRSFPNLKHIPTVRFPWRPVPHWGRPARTCQKNRIATDV